MELEKIILNVNNSPMGIPIKNKQFINYLIKSINFNYSVRGHDQTFPAPQPVSIEKKDFLKLKQYKYYTGLKLDGVRFLMYFIKDKNNKNQCIIINRALNFYNIIINAEDTLYNGTLLDGEIIYDTETKQWDFVVHDALIICGNKINKLSHSVRLNDTKLCVESFINYNNTSTLNIKIKKFYPFEEFAGFIENVYNKSNNNDGIIFMPENLPVISGTQYSMLKWKPENKHTFDFFLKEVDIGLEAYVFHMGNLNIFANIHAKTEQGKEFIEKSKQLDNYKNECIVESIFDKDKNNFTPILVRTDKTHPNSLRTIERTLFNISENIKIEDFMSIELNDNNQSVE
jgi:hypothetical protein